MTGLGYLARSEYGNDELATRLAVDYFVYPSHGRRTGRSLAHIRLRLRNICKIVGAQFIRSSDDERRWSSHPFNDIAPFRKNHPQFGEQFVDAHEEDYTGDDRRVSGDCLLVCGRHEGRESDRANDAIVRR